MIILVGFPAISLTIGPLVYLPISVENNGSSATTEVKVVVSNVSGRKYENIPRTKRHYQTRLVQTYITILKVPDWDHHAELSTLIVPMRRGRDIEVDDHGKKRICSSVDVARK